MKLDAEKGVGPLQAKINDSRITKIGKILRQTAMDELPQLINIVRGDMSFVGPRALRPVEIDSGDSMPRNILDFPGGMERCSVLPGLTGVAQVLASRDIPRSEKFKYDLWYVRNRNFPLDLYLIILSFAVTLKAGWGQKGNKFVYLAKNFKIKVERELHLF
jgi:lipopolysaccharide/colanic/teichoic acid biosynthesis glycosyltransferase